jgi:hypothetical protein
MLPSQVFSEKIPLREIFRYSYLLISTESIFPVRLAANFFSEKA